jgi:hypothetical protein
LGFIHVKEEEEEEEGGRPSPFLDYILRPHHGAPRITHTQFLHFFSFPPPFFVFFVRSFFFFPSFDVFEQCDSLQNATLSIISLEKRKKQVQHIIT